MSESDHPSIREAVHLLAELKECGYTRALLLAEAADHVQEGCTAEQLVALAERVHDRVFDAAA